MTVNFVDESIKLLKDGLKGLPFIALRAEMEAEGSRIEEIKELKEIADKLNLPLHVKIGGAEAVSDLLFLKEIGVDGIIAPMIESEFALEKFRLAVNRVFGENNGIEKAICIETELAVKNAKKIIENGKDFLSTVTIGRIDLSSSLKMGRQFVDGKKIFSMAKKVAVLSEKNGVKTRIGGGINKNTYPFINGVGTAFCGFETRKTVFGKIENEEDFIRAIKVSASFEKLFLLNRIKLYGSDLETEKRLKLLEERV